MTKLLHERLREYMKDGVLIDHESPLTQALEHYKLTPRLGSVYVESCFFKKLADEIEREYIPRPRFEDGEPVQFGDSAKRDFGTADAENIDKMTFCKGGSVDVIGSNGHFSTSRNGECLKRLYPKVYDADGVEYKDGQTVWSTDPASPESAKVIRVNPNSVDVRWSNGERGECIDPLYLTHERTVFDTNGERIKVGDEGLDDKGNRCIVIGIGDAGFVNLKYDDGEIFSLSPTRFAHREPDSFDKAMERFKSILEDKDGLDYEVEEKLWAVHNRLTALIERGV